MDVLLALAVGVLVTGAAYLMLARDLPRMLIGFVLLGTAANLVILAAGRVGPIAPPLIGADQAGLAAGAANPLPQALILTAIVIGLGLAAFALMLIVKASVRLGSVRPEEMDAAEPGTPPAPPVPAPAAPAPRREAA